jgi:hypothetical protein
MVRASPAAVTIRRGPTRSSSAPAGRLRTTEVAYITLMSPLAAVGLTARESWMSESTLEGVIS